jgi:hypothetical protein
VADRSHLELGSPIGGLNGTSEYPAAYFGEFHQIYVCLRLIEAWIGSKTKYHPLSLSGLALIHVYHKLAGFKSSQALDKIDLTSLPPVEHGKNCKTDPRIRDNSSQIPRTGKRIRCYCSILPLTRLQVANAQPDTRPKRMRSTRG